MTEPEAIANGQSSTPIKKAPSMWLWMAIGIPLGLLTMAVLGLLMVLPDLLKATPAKNTSVCLDNLAQLSNAALLYAEDNNGYLPADHWSEKIRPMLKEQDADLIFACPVQRRIDPETFGYALNEEVAGKKKGSVPLPQNTVFFFDSTNVKLNAIDSLKTLPSPGRHNHLRSNNVVYIDGHTRTIPSR